MSIAARIQDLSSQDQASVLGRILESRSDGREFFPKDLDNLFTVLGLPLSSTVGNLLQSLERNQLARKGVERGAWLLTPKGRERADELANRHELAALSAEAVSNGPELGHVKHATLPPLLGPPTLIAGVQAFLNDYGFENNVFGMTRFPDNGDSDPVKSAVEVTRNVCSLHGLDFHLASDRAITDDLWTNVTAHMWASKYGIAFFEDSVGRGLNYNMSIEVGGMLMTGRRCCLLKDTSISSMPTDLVGQIYKEVNLSDEAAVADAVHTWLREDLRLGSCTEC